MEREPEPDASVSPTGPTAPARARSQADAIGDAIGDARPVAAGLEMARARAASVLFGEGDDVPSVGLGRFRVLERLGAGGMGVVYAAYDPELDRGVALKLVAVPARGRDAAVAEAKALARLSHPNVVPVYDVGVERDHVYIVMELVRGETLRRWTKQHTRDEILDAYRQAGEALAAAHAVGLVHRDFKPDNAIVGADGRVRVVDFGLAVDAADPSRPGEARGDVAGTPRYMAPEQRASAAVTAAADQYSFCVALEEALIVAADGAPLPRWLATVLERGRSKDPEQRFPTMRDLLRALGRDPSKVRRRRIAVAAVALVGAGAAFAIGTILAAPEEEVCVSGKAELASTWAPAARAAALAKIAALDPYGATLAPILDERLQHHATRWIAGHRDACLAHRRGAQSAAMLDRRMACLERGRSALGAVAAILEGADRAKLDGTVLAVNALPDPGACADLHALLAEVAPPPADIAARVQAVRAQVDRARVQVAAGQFEAAQTAASAAVAQARVLAYRPLVGEGLLVQGHAMLRTDQRGAAQLLAEATRVAFAVGHDAVAIEASARRMWSEATGGKADTALIGADVIEAIAERTPSARFARALLYYNIGSAELARSRRADARLAFDRAVKEARDITGAGAVELTRMRSNLGLVMDDPVERDALLTGVEVELAQHLGADHLYTLLARGFRVEFTVSLASAVALQTPACEGFGRNGDVSRMAGQCWAQVAFARDELGDRSGALAATERAAQATPGYAEDRLDERAPEIGPYLALRQGDARRAAGLFAAAIERRPTSAKPSWWVQRDRALLEVGLGSARRALGDRAAARAPLEASVATLATVLEQHPNAALQHRLARARAELALSLDPTDSRVAVLASSALAWMQQSGANADDVRQLERLATVQR